MNDTVVPWSRAPHDPREKLSNDLTFFEADSYCARAASVRKSLPLSLQKNGTFTRLCFRVGLSVMEELQKEGLA